jgi:hypothetical protein
MIKSLDIRIKIVVLNSYRGKILEANFVTFFVLHAKELKLMTLTVPDKSYNEKFVELQRRQLQLQNRASKGAQFHFTPKSDSRIENVMNIVDAHDLDLWDPFVEGTPKQNPPFICWRGSFFYCCWSYSCQSPMFSSVLLSLE